MKTWPHGSLLVCLSVCVGFYPNFNIYGHNWVVSQFHSFPEYPTSNYQFLHKQPEPCTIMFIQGQTPLIFVLLVFYQLSLINNVTSRASLWTCPKKTPFSNQQLPIILKLFFLSFSHGKWTSFYLTTNKIA